MEYNEYLEHMKKTINYDLSNKDMFENACYGLIGETGEVADVIKKSYFQGHELNEEKIIDELGDCFWYLTYLGWVVCNKNENYKKLSEEIIQKGQPLICFRRFPYLDNTKDDYSKTPTLELVSAIFDKVHRIIIYKEPYFVSRKAYILEIIDVIEEISELYICILERFCEDKTLDDVLNHNVLKLSLRYKDGFKTKDSIERKG